MLVITTAQRVADQPGLVKKSSLAFARAAPKLAQRKAQPRRPANQKPRHKHARSEEKEKKIARWTIYLVDSRQINCPGIRPYSSTTHISALCATRSASWGCLCCLHVVIVALGWPPYQTFTKAPNLLVFVGKLEEEHGFLQLIDRLISRPRLYHHHARTPWVCASP